MNLLLKAVFVALGVGLIAVNANASLYADVLCYYEQGINTNTGYDTPENAVSVDGETAPSGLVSLGGWTDDSTTGNGYTTGLMIGFSTSIANGEGDDLNIVGNPMTNWYEPGYVEVAMESSGSGATEDGWMDETFYLLKPSNYDTVGDPRDDALAVGYPYNNNWSQNVTGYADVTVGGDTMDIDWAIDDEGNFVELDDIAYVRIRTATDDSAGIFGYFTTEINYVEALNGTAAVPIPGAIWLLGTGLLSLMGIRRRK